MSYRINRAERTSNIGFNFYQTRQIYSMYINLIKSHSLTITLYIDLRKAFLINATVSICSYTTDKPCLEKKSYTIFENVRKIIANFCICHSVTDCYDTSSPKLVVGIWLVNDALLLSLLNHYITYSYRYYFCYNNDYWYVIDSSFIRTSRLLTG